MTTRIRARLLPRWPASVTANLPIALARSGSAYTFSFSMSGIGTETMPPSSRQLITWDGSAMHLTTIAEALVAGGAAPLAASYVTIGTSGALTNERVLTAGSGVTLSDAGPGFALTVSIGSNAIADALLRDSAPLSVIGRSANSFGDPADIAASSDGEVLRRSGDLLGFGPVTTAGIGNDAVTFAKMQDIATARLLGRTTASTGDPEALTGTQATAILDTVVGDTGSGGTKGLVPAPISGDAAAGKFLKADGTWAAPSAATAPIGSVINTAIGTYSANADLTATIPFDDTIPQVSEGTQIISVSITPAASANRIRARFQGFFAASISDRVSAAIFVNGGSNAIAATAVAHLTTSGEDSLALECEYGPGSTSTQTFSVRVGPNSAGNVRFNGSGGARRFGGVAAATLCLDEIKG